jgi:hypothetical protein
MPATTRSSVDAIVATLDRALDDMAAGLRGEASELARRAVVAANDMLTAAGLPPLPGTAPTAGPTLIGGGHFGTITNSHQPTTMTLGGNHFGTVTITNPDGTPYVAPATMTIGGNTWGSITAMAPSGTVIGATTMIGGGIRNDPTGLLALAQVQQNSHDRAQVIIDRLVRSGNPAAVSAGLAAQGRQGAPLSHILAPSRTELENRAGHSLTWTEIARISPNTVPFGLR